MEQFDIVIVGTGPSAFGCAFELLDKKPGLRLLLIDKQKVSTGGLRNDCKMNFSWPIGFPEDVWDEQRAGHYLQRVERFLQPEIMAKRQVETYALRAERLGVKLLDVRQSHLGTDGGLKLIHRLMDELRAKGVQIALGETAGSVDLGRKVLVTDQREIAWTKLVIAPGRGGFGFLQGVMRSLDIAFRDNVVDVGVRVETRQEHYPIVSDYYDPKFHFPGKVRTFCTNSGSAHVVQEKYATSEGKAYYSVNGHAFSEAKPRNGLVNFAVLKTVRLTEPLASGPAYAEMLSHQASLLGGGHPLMQRVGDFRLGRRSTRAAFNGDLYDFEPTMPGATPGDIALAVPAKILRAIWGSLKLLDTIVPGVLHPSTIMYYPEIKLYANKPSFVDEYFRVAEGLYLIGDGAGTSRGITAAWASGIRAADGILGS
jgi:uncharacterized FAD-dependent dehydrogenase